MVYRVAMICSLLHSNSANHGNFWRGLWLGLSRLPVSRLAAGLVDDLGERYVLIKYTPRAYWFSFTWIARFTLCPTHSGGEGRGRELHCWIVGVDYLGTPAAWRSLSLLWYPISVSDSSSGCTRSSIRRLHSNWMRIECIGLTFTCSHFAVLFHIQIPCINGMFVMGFIKVVKSWKIWLSDLLWELDCSSTRRNSCGCRSRR